MVPARRRLSPGRYERWSRVSAASKMGVVCASIPASLRASSPRNLTRRRDATVHAYRRSADRHRASMEPRTHADRGGSPATCQSWTTLHKDWPKTRAPVSRPPHGANTVAIEPGPRSVMDSGLASVPRAPEAARPRDEPTGRDRLRYQCRRFRALCARTSRDDSLSVSRCYWCSEARGSPRWLVPTSAIDCGRRRST